MSGYVSNTSIGVDIEVEGESTQLDLFIDAIKSNRLPLAHIAKIQMTAVAPQENEGFVIKESASHVKKMTSIPPDICNCEDCLMEMQSPGDRRYRYPFINCTNCGPRYTIIEDVPYDGPYTSMRKFTMCGDCLKKYMDPSNRRFHAQPNACPVCGPGITLYGSSQNALKGDDPISSAIDLLKRGHIIADHGITILTQREGLTLDSPIGSDTAPLNRTVEEMMAASSHIDTLRDPTRGGLATSLNEIAIQSQVGIKLYEKKIPVRDETRGACELLGLDALYLANEGKLIACVAPEDADRVLTVVRNNPYGKNASIIGDIISDNIGKAFMETAIGGKRIIDMLTGEPLPRIC